MRAPQLTIILITVLGLTGCTALTTARPGTSPATLVGEPNWASTAAADQYLRAAATSTRQAAILDENLRNVQAQASRTAVAADQATQQAYMQASSTAVAAHQATQQAHMQASSTAVAAHQATQQAYALATGTARAEHQATQTQIAVSTQTALAVQATQANLQRQQMLDGLGLVFLSVVLGILVYALWRGVQVLLDVLRKQGAIVRYGPHGNPLAIFDAPSGPVLFDPLRATGAVTLLNGQGAAQLNELPPAERARYLQQLLWVLQTQAQHNPFPPSAHPPEVRERRRGAEVEKAPSTTVLEPETTSAPLTPFVHSHLPATEVSPNIIEGQFRELPPEGDVGAWLAEVKQKLLVAGESA